MVDLIPRSVLFGNPERTSPRISPDGTQLAWIAPRDGVLNVWVAPIGASGVAWDAARAVTEDTDRGVRVFTWARDGQHVLYLQDVGGAEGAAEPPGQPEVTRPAPGHAAEQGVPHMPMCIHKARNHYHAACVQLVAAWRHRERRAPPQRSHRL